MKKIIFLTIALFATTLAFAQNFGTTQFATLSRNDSIIGTYYGNGALEAAYNAAIDSDIVTLSAGHFYAPGGIDKVITIRGVGYDTVTNIETLPTYIDGYPYSGNISISKNILMEGVYCQSFYGTFMYSPNIKFNKCRFDRIQGGESWYYGTISQCIFTNCLISEWDGQYTTQTVFTNCVILNSYNNSYDIYNNCIIGISPELTNYKEIRNSITFSNDTTGIGNATNVYNTVGIRTQNSAQFYTNRAGRNNQTFHSFSSIFKTFNGTYTEGETFELQDNIANTLLGSDSTQIGIYGGALPFNSRVTDPRIIGHSADIHSNANGQINVYINLRNSNN